MFPLFYFIFLSIFLSFFPSFFLHHTRTLHFFFLYFLISSLSLPLPPHTCPYFFFSLFPYFSLPLHSRIFHKLQTPLIPQAGSRSASLFFFFFFFDTSKADDDDEEDEDDDDDEEVSASLFSSFFFISLFCLSFFILFFFTLQRR